MRITRNRAERWRSVLGYEGIYEVSDVGRVRRIGGTDKCRVTRYRKTPVDSKGYPYVSLWRNGEERKYRVHTLVLTAFVGVRPEGEEACHRNGDRGDPRLRNLRWGTHVSNLEDKVTHGTAYGEDRHHWSKLNADMVREIRRRVTFGHTQEEIAAVMGIHRATVSDIWRGKSWKHV